MVFRRIKIVPLVEVLLHILFWTFITLLPILTRPPASGFRMLLSPWHLVFINSLFAAHFYLNTFLLIPEFLNKHNRPFLYCLLLALSLIAIDFCIVHAQPPMGMFNHLHRFGPPPLMAHFNLLPMAAITAASFAYRYLADRARLINNKRDIANSALVSELAFLRSQISPHFIFNVINGVVALSRLNPPAVEPTLMQLSQLLRYMLYITDEEKVTMGQKSDYMGSYIDLQKMRFDDQIIVDFIFDITHPEKTIEPMLLVPFLENAFKYAGSNDSTPFIKGYLKADHRMVSFSVSNNYDPAHTHTDEHHGIGLNNVKRRLDLLYPGKHSLEIKQDQNNYTVNLQIQFK